MGVTLSVDCWIGGIDINGHFPNVDLILPREFSKTGQMRLQQVEVPGTNGVLYRDRGTTVVKRDFLALAAASTMDAARDFADKWISVQGGTMQVTGDVTWADVILIQTVADVRAGYLNADGYSPAVCLLRAVISNDPRTTALDI